MIKNNNNFDSLSKSLIADVRAVMEGKKSCGKSCKCDKCMEDEKAEKKADDENAEMKTEAYTYIKKPPKGDYKKPGQRVSGTIGNGYVVRGYRNDDNVDRIHYKVQLMHKPDDEYLKDFPGAKWQERSKKDEPEHPKKFGSKVRAFAFARKLRAERDERDSQTNEAYDEVAVNKAINSSNRSGKKISPKEAKMIHALLKGRTKDDVKEEIEQLDELSPELLRRASAKSRGEADWAHAIGKRYTQPNSPDHQKEQGAKFLNHAAKRNALAKKADAKSGASTPTPAKTHDWYNSSSPVKNEEVEQIDEISHKLRSSWLSKTFNNHFDHRMDDSDSASGWRIDPPIKGPMSASRLKIYGKALDKARKQNMNDYEDRERAKREKYTPKVHDLRDMDHDEVYDYTQTSNKIKDGDVMRVKNGTAALIGAWPTMIHGKSDVLHSFKPGTSIKTIDGGSYHKTSKLADLTHGIKEEAVNEAKAESPIKGTRLISKHQGKDGHHAEVRFNPDYNEYQVHHYNNGKHMGEGPVSYHGEGKEGREDATNTAEYEVNNYRPKNGSLRKEEVEVVDNEFNRANYKHLIGKRYPDEKVPSYARVKKVEKKPLVGNQHKLDKNKNGKLDAQDFKMLRKGKSIEEKLDPSMGSAKYIDDFVNSKDPRFEGKSKKERIKMALGAYYAAKNEAVETKEVDQIDEKYGAKTNYKKHHISVNGKYVATTTWARSAKEAEQRFIQQHPEHKNKRITVIKER